VVERRALTGVRRALAALLVALMPFAHAQAPRACPAPEEVLPVHLYGEWLLELWGEQDAEPPPAMASDPLQRGRVRLERHPEFEGNVRGQVWLRPDAVAAMLAGDVTDGELVLDESRDGQRIDAVWVGAPHDCARRFEGSRRPADHRLPHEAPLRFRLQKLPGWR